MEDAAKARKRVSLYFEDLNYFFTQYSYCNNTYPVSTQNLRSTRLLIGTRVDLYSSASDL